MCFNSSTVHMKYVHISDQYENWAHLGHWKWTSHGLNYACMSGGIDWYIVYIYMRTEPSLYTRSCRLGLYVRSHGLICLCLKSHVVIQNVMATVSVYAICDHEDWVTDLTYIQWRWSLYVHIFAWPYKFMGLSDWPDLISFIKTQLLTWSYKFHQDWVIDLTL